MQGLFGEGQASKGVRLLLPMGLIFISFSIFGLMGTVLIQQFGYAADSYEGVVVLQIFSVLGLFIIPSLLIPKIVVNRNSFSYLGLNRLPKIGLLVLVVVLAAMQLPWINWVYMVNKAMSLPAGLEGLEASMKKMEESALKTTEMFVTGTSYWHLLRSLLLVAGLAAVSEELFFRGLLVNGLYSLTKKKWVAVWVSAILFSAIHLQFYGFIPRMLLGVVFGYVFVWTGNLWLCIALHFSNNAISVIQAWQQQRQGEAIQIDAVESLPWFWVVGSIALTILILWRIKESSKRVRLPSAKAALWGNLIEMKPEATWKKLATYKDGLRAEMAKGLLESREVAVSLLDRRDNMLKMGLVELWVPEGMMAEAQAILAEGGYA